MVIYGTGLFSRCHVYMIHFGNTSDYIFRAKCDLPDAQKEVGHSTYFHEKLKDDRPLHTALTAKDH